MVSLNAVQRVQDPVHGLMEFRGSEAVIIDLLRTPELRRLRRIRQMGLAQMVFPGAEHSRFVHALGVANLALRFAQRAVEESEGLLPQLLRPDAEAIRDFAVAALCHDIGHGPLSHMWEREVVGGRDYDLEGWCRSLGLDPDDVSQGSGVPAWHELITQGFLSWPEGELHRLLEQFAEGFSERLRLLLSGCHYLPYLTSLLDGDIDVDRADFLLRDAHNCGVGYGRYDLFWLMSTYAIGYDENGYLVGGFDRRKAAKVVEQFLVARGAMYDSVYHHKTVRSIEGMVGLLLRRLRSLDPDMLEVLNEGQPFMRPFVKALAGEPLEPQELLCLDDFGLWHLIDCVASVSGRRFDHTSWDLANRILKRDLFKMIPVKSRQLERFLRNLDADAQLRSAVEEGSATGDPSFYAFADEASKRLLNPPGSGHSFLIDLAHPDRKATPLARCHELRHLGGEGDEAEVTVVRLFAVRDAVEAVHRAVGV